jgi:hypothetical protein
MTGGTPEVLCCAQFRGFAAGRSLFYDNCLGHFLSACSCEYPRARHRVTAMVVGYIRNRQCRGRRSEGISGPSTERKLWLVETSQYARPAVWYTAAKFILLHTNESDKESGHPAWRPVRLVTSVNGGPLPPRAPHFLALVAFLLTEHYHGVPWHAQDVSYIG